MDYINLFKCCRLCPRNCRVNRLENSELGFKGFCGENHLLRVAYVGPHFGEEPPITGRNGSGTVFFSGCSLKCSFCQNYQISRDGLGEIIGTEELQKSVVTMIQEKNVHNINFVTPDHYLPYTLQLGALLRKRGYELPFVYNLSGYQSLRILRFMEDYADIYLPDYKYADPSIAWRLSKCKDYPGVALEAIVEMVRQKGFLHPSASGSDPAKKGVLVRHLILPGMVENSLSALTTLFLEFGAKLPLSLMSQYHPALLQPDKDLFRFLSKDEFDKVYTHVLDLGFENLYVQFPDPDRTTRSKISPFLPDFEKDKAFSGISER